MLDIISGCCTFSESELFSKLTATYTAVYLIIPQDNALVELKSMEQGVVLEKYPVYDWHEYLKAWITKNVSSEYISFFKKFLEPSTITEIFNDSSQNKDVLFKSLSGSWYRLTLWPIRKGDSNDTYVLMTISVMTEIKKQVEELIQASNFKGSNVAVDLLLMAARETYKVIFEFELGKSPITFIDLQQEDDLNPKELTKQQVVELIIKDIHPEDKTRVLEKAHTAYLDGIKNKSETFSFRARNNKGEFRWCSAKISIYLVENDKEVRKLVKVFVTDVNDEIKERNMLLNLSEHDSLTDLFNKTKLATMENSEYKHLKTCGILFMDINNLKSINEISGYEAGDKTLKLVSEAIRSIMSRRVHGYRYGGDEFVVICTDTTEEEVSSLYRMWTARLNALKTQNNLDFTVSVGSSYLDKKCDVQGLIEVACARMNDNKIK